MLVVTFQNDDTGNDIIGHYDVTVWNDSRAIYSTRITDHVRQEGWRQLLQRLFWEAK